VTTVREWPVPLDGPAGDVDVVALLGSFVRSRSVQDDPIHALIGRFRAGEAAAFAEVLRAGRPMLDRDEPLHGAQVAALVVPGHDGTRQAGLVRLVAELAVTSQWTVPDRGLLIRHAHVPEAKQRQPRDRVAELASLRGTPATLPRVVETILLVDDVLASGGTIRACVDALRRDGWAGGVAALVLARAR
jgi:hypothetical protein